MRAGHIRKTDHVIGVCGFEPHEISPASRRGGQMEIEFKHVANESVIYVIIVRPQIKTLDTEAQVSFLVGDTC